MSGDETRLQGKRAESVVEFMADRYRQAGIATIWKQGTIAIPTKLGWKPINSLPDFGGVLHGSGRYIAFDVKSTTQRHYHHPKERGHQLEQLWRVSRAGGIAGLLIQHLPSYHINKPKPYDEAWYWVKPFPEWENGTSSSITIDTWEYVTKLPNWQQVSEPFPDFLAYTID